MKLSKGNKLTIFALILLVIDQIVKVLVKTNMTIGESIPVIGDWFQILFVENDGMAFGMSFGGDIGKYFLTTFRIILSCVLILWIRRLLKREDEVPTGVLIALTAILCGALGNIVDCLFYGIIFSESTISDVAQFLPMEGGYAPMLLGRVVDMFYFPIIETTLPDWVPIWGGREFTFFNAIFNVADSCITVGAAYLIIFQWKFFNKQ